MNNLKLIYTLILVFLITILINLNCEKKPTAPVRNNPLDTKANNYEGHPPVAVFTVTPVAGDIIQIFNFDASACSDNDEPTDSLQVRWDWEGDGVYDTNYSTTKKATHQYDNYGIKDVILQVKDSQGLTDTTSKQIQVSDVYKDMVYVPAGEFTMGSTSGRSDEQPVHTVYLDAYYIDKYEVTNEKYAVYLTEALANGEINASSDSVTKDGNKLLALDDPDCQISYSGGSFTVDSGKENYPVIEVTWYGADAYAKHYGNRLPTEAEWEKAARGTTEVRTYPWGNDSPTSSHCNFNSNIGHTTAVGTYSPLGESPYGCCDMAGNVWEWCNDWYELEYYNNSPPNNPQGPSSGIYRVMRGGSWSYDKSYVRCSARSAHYPHSSSDLIGFRLVR